MKSWFDWFWHKKLRRAYRLACPIDEGHGAPVVLLHGIAGSAAGWRYLVARSKDAPTRVVALDLLGFGQSPKPSWAEYNIDDHARAVIHAIGRKHFREPVILVGHSMGSLIAVHVAKLRPDLVCQLILYEIPLYEGLPAKRRYNLRRGLYYAMYRRIIGHPNYSQTNVRALQKIVARVMGFVLTEQTWLPFVQSLKNTIMAQTALADLKKLAVPTEIIYGSLDIVVIRGKPHRFFGKEAKHITSHVIPELHGISQRASKFLAGRIIAAAELPKAGHRNG